jgi:hypothetical protein
MSQNNLTNNPRVLPAQLAGISYPDEPQQALEFFEAQLCKADQGLYGKIPLEYPTLIVPHIDFRVNLELYARTYAALWNRGHFPETFIVLGVGHKCPHNLSSIPFSFKTPLGQIDGASDAWHLFSKGLSHSIDLAEKSYHSEHSLEYVVIWLQALQQLYFPDKKFKVLPILLGGLWEDIVSGDPPLEESLFVQQIEAFQNMLHQLDPRKTCIIASIDGCHVGPRFDHPFPADQNIQLAVTHWENDLWKKTSSDQFPAFWQHLTQVHNGFYFDGVGVLTLLLEAMECKASDIKTVMWHEEKDQSLVTFSSGLLLPQ